MKINNLIFTAEQISGNKEGVGILISSSPVYEYSDGKKTGNISHIKYNVVFPNAGYEKESIKIEGKVPVIINEDIANAGKDIKVKFKNLTGKHYVINGREGFSIKADGIEVIS